MAELNGKPINYLPEATSLSDADLFAVSHSGAANHIKWSNFKTAITNMFAPSNINASAFFGGSVTGIDSVSGRKSFSAVDAYITFNSSISSGSIATVASAYRPAHTVCFPLFSASSPYAPVGAMWIYTNGNVQIYYSARPGWAYANYLI